jgi:hypothetical protein
MSFVNVEDPRTRLVREKYFTLRPKPLERWLWQQAVSQSAERVFWLHWEEGMRAGDWCSQIPLRQVAAGCCVDTSTVTRAYQQLKLLGLIRREDPGRDPHNPFQQATAITEVRLPRALLSELHLAPNRRKINSLRDPQALPSTPLSTTGSSGSTASDRPRAPSRAQIQATWGRASAAEQSRYFNASRTGVRSIEFDVDTRLSAEERSQLLLQLRQMAGARISVSSPSISVRPGPSATNESPHSQRRLSAFAIARIRQRTLGLVGAEQATQKIVRQVVWAVEEGALRRFAPPLALNIALKKIREGTWTRPNRMPPNWSRPDAPHETCSAA